ncbi:response regulator transcription factor [Emticicia sp. BO119]|uniref:response regulator n=1 Tax=Emticicia sp. BO119 TaxID=2757768 RepID=UPI0015F096B6|nr:response regulator transcription factor [Emticicia sp. BO119]MBA4852550.1 response regulator transcription factor [Emticicia sp. BO119]
MKIIKIGIVDDNPTLLKNISRNLSIYEELHIDFTAISGRDALRKLNEHTPDVLLMDIEMPLMDGIETTREIKTRFPDQKIMMLTVSDREDKIFEAIKAGATGYLLKEERPSKILASIEELMEGGAPMSPAIAAKTLEILRKQQVNDTYIQNTESPATFNLTKREIEVIENIASGLTYSQIALKLFISTKTTRKHIENIYLKLQVHSKLEVVQLAQKNKWI